MLTVCPARSLLALLLHATSIFAVLGAGCRETSTPPASFRGERIDGSNGFKSHEVFRTSTTAATGYDAYVTWDSTTLYLGLTGQDLGEPACTPAETADGEACPRYEQGEAPTKHLVYYFDTDPNGQGGTTEAAGSGATRWTLPFHADYYLTVQTDYADSGIASFYAYSGGRWREQDVELDVADNDGSKFIELALPRSALGAPCGMKVIGWVADSAGGGASYAFWPHNAAAADADSAGVVEGAGGTLHHYYGFLLIDGQTPNASDGQANLDRPFFEGAACAPVNGDSPEGSAEGSARPFHTIGFTTSNDFSGREAFRTSTTAATGYDAYFTWDRTNLYLGVTGSDIGPGDCDGTDSTTCAPFETGEAPTKWLTYYLDTDPQADERGTTEAISFGRQRWTLPFRADYAVVVRTDGVTDERGYTGVADLKRWSGATWESLGPSALEIFDNSTSGFLKLSVARDALGAPDFLRTVGWMFDADAGFSYAFWPANAVEPVSGHDLAPDTLRAKSDGTAADSAGTGSASAGSTAAGQQRTRTPEARPDSTGLVRDSTVQVNHAYGFVLIDGQVPNASDGQANLDRPFVAGLRPEPVNGDSLGGASGSAAQPFHTIGRTTSNDFSGREVFRTSTDAATGYDAYVTWDAANLYVGATGSDIGPGDCVDTSVDTCDPFETGQRSTKWFVTYLDTNPTEGAGTDTAIAFGDQSWQLPFRADYALLIRTDGYTDAFGYTGVADLKRWSGETWESLGPGALEIFDNSTSGFLKLAVTREALGSPSFLQAVSWFFDTDTGVSYAYWPANAPASGDSLTTGAATLAHAYGFRLEHGQVPNASNGLANLDRPFFGPYDCASTVFGDGGGDYAGQGRPFHTVSINGSNSFNTQREAFPTSTKAATGYAAYATWDRTHLYLGMTGSNIGGGDCSDAGDDDCTRAETGQQPDRWLVYYLDTDPLSERGTREALHLPDTLGTDQSWRLPFAADYAVLLRTDGQTIPLGHTGVAEVRRWDGQRWASRGPCGLQVWDNNGSGYLEAALALDAIGYPYHLKIVGWMFGAETAYAYWPADAASDGRADGTRLETWWGFDLRSGILPNSLGNKNRRFYFGTDDQLPYTTYTLNGRRDNGEYRPAESLGRESPGAAVGPNNPELFVTWDEAALYLGLLGDPLVAGRSDLWVAVDTDPAPGDPRSGSGLTAQPTSEATHGATATYPFAADLVFRFEGMRRDSAGARRDTAVQQPAPGRLFTAGDSTWAEGAMPEGVRAIRPSSGAPTEVAISWMAMDGLGADSAATFHVVFYLIDAENGIDAQWPPDNPNGSEVAFSSFRSYARAPGAAPAADATRSLLATGGVALDDEVYANVYLVPDASQTVTLGTHTTVVGELFVGPNATLDVGTNGKDPSGHNRLRVGRRLAVEGTFEPREGVVLTFDPAEGYPPSIEPGGGFARPSQPTEIAGGTFHALTLHNRTELVAPSDSARTDSAQVVLRGPLTIAAGGRLHGRDLLAARPATSESSSRTDTASDSTREGSGRETGRSGGEEGWLDRIARFLRGEAADDGNDGDPASAEGASPGEGRPR
jgi:hypothetical protein